MVVSRGLRDQLKTENPVLLKRLLEVMKELEESLNADPHTIFRLLREPVVARFEGVPLRRYRVGDYRFYYVIDVNGCRVVFLDLEISYHRGKTYRDLRRRRKFR